MNMEIGAEAALFPEKEYINGIAVAVQSGTRDNLLGGPPWSVWPLVTIGILLSDHMDSGQSVLQSLSLLPISTHNSSH